MFNCQFGLLRIKYLGVPVTFSKLKNSNWDFLEAKLIKNWTFGFVNMLLLRLGLLCWILAYVVFLPITWLCFFLTRLLLGKWINIEGDFLG
jgi:hypothetical protein